MIFSATKPALRGGFFLSCFAATTALVAVVWVIFRAALPGVVHFDDIGNLAGLATISDFDSAWRWMREGHAGPMGRPLALATFALQYYEWPHPEAFLVWNIALHVVNALFVFWLSVLVARRLGHIESKQVAIGFLVAVTWAVLPMLNSSVLFIVQRMTVLSATFVLAGLIAYLKVRGAIDAKWPRQTAALLALAMLGALALLAKESGALIVVYALVLELLLMRQVRMRRLTFAAMLLLGANVLMVIALLPLANWAQCADLHRGFTVWERLGSQGALLPVYLKGIFLPTASDLNPFRFEFLLRDVKDMRWGGLVWFTLMASPLIAWCLGWRLRALALALAWFFYGHIMESGWVSLEPYFAHRNYLPALGLVFPIVAWAFAGEKGAVLWRGIGIVYLLMLATVAWMNTSLWGDRALAAEIWAKEQPRSTRAALNLAYYLEQSHGLAIAQDYLDRAMTEERDSAGLRLQSLVSACRLDAAGDHSGLVRNAVKAIQTLPYEGWATDLVEKLLDQVNRKNCNGITLIQVAEIATAFLNKPAYQCSGPIIHNMLSALGVVALQEGQTDQALDFFIQGLQQSISYSTANFYLDVARQHDNIEAIRKLRPLVAGAETPPGSTPAEWKKLLDDIDSSLPK